MCQFVHLLHVRLLHLTSLQYQVSFTYTALGVVDLFLTQDGDKSHCY